jgi:hypothetical protein
MSMFRGRPANLDMTNLFLSLLSEDSPGKALQVIHHAEEILKE